MMMTPYMFVVLYVTICVIYLTRMRHSVEKPNRVIFKALPIGMLIGASMSYLQQSRLLAIKNADFLPRVYTLGGGLVFACMSNLYSEFPSLASYGIVCYAISLSTYVYGFSSSLTLFRNMDSTDVAVVTGIAVMSLAVYMYLWPRLSVILSLFVAFYTVLEGSFLCVMIMVAIRLPLLPVVGGAVGASVLYFSDILQAVHMWRERVNHAHTIIMATYYLAQLLITGSILLVIA